MADKLPYQANNVVKGNFGSGSGGDGMDTRLTKLEANYDHMSRDVAELRTDMKDVKSTLSDIKLTLVEMRASFDKLKDTVSGVNDRIDGVNDRIDGLPTKTFVWTRFSAVAAAMVTAFAIVVANKEFFIKVLGFL